MAKRYDALIHQGAVAPYAIVYTVTSEDQVVFDLSTVTAAEIHVLRECGDSVIWSANISDQSITSLTVTRVLQATDVPEAETIVIEPRLSTPAGQFVCESKVVKVKARFT